MIATVTCNPSLDYHMSLPCDLKPGMPLRAKGTSVRLGGKGINVSCVLAHLGQASTAYGFVAGRTGKMLLSMAEEENLCFSPVWVRDGMSRINVKVHASQETEINGDGPLVSERDSVALLKKLAVLQEGDTLVLSGSLANGLPASWYADVMEKMQGKGIRFVVDTTGKSLLDVLPSQPFLVKPNEKELGELFSVSITSADDAAWYGKKLVRKGARHVLVSRGGEGAVLVGEGDSYLASNAPKGKVVDTIGSGDSMVAGFLYGWEKEHTEEGALTWGAAAGTATAFSDHLATRGEIEDILPRIEITRGQIRRP